MISINEQKFLVYTLSAIKITSASADGKNYGLIIIGFYIQRLNYSVCITQALRRAEFAVADALIFLHITRVK